MVLQVHPYIQRIACTGSIFTKQRQNEIYGKCYSYSILRMNTSLLNGRDNVILTPHVAFYSQASVRDAKIHSAENILYYLKGEYNKCSIINGVNA